MTNLRQAAQQALEALIPLANAASPNERECLTDEDHERAAEALEALCAALAEPEQEPVGWQWLDTANYRKKLPANAIREHWRPLYTAPTPRKPLTEPELHAITPTWPAPGQEWGYEEVLAFVRAIERAHGIGEQT